MAKVIKRQWAGESDTVVTRRDRQSCEYEVYIPDAQGAGSAPA